MRSYPTENSTSDMHDTFVKLSVEYILPTSHWCYTVCWLYVQHSKHVFILEYYAIETFFTQRLSQ